MTTFSKLFRFNNSAFFSENNDSCEQSFDEMFLKMGPSHSKHFFQEFPKAESVSLPPTNEVLKEQEELHMLVEGLNVQITEGLSNLKRL